MVVRLAKWLNHVGEDELQHFYGKCSTSCQILDDANLFYSVYCDDVFVFMPCKNFNGGFDVRSPSRNAGASTLVCIGCSFDGKGENLSKHSLPNHH